MLGCFLGYQWDPGHFNRFCRRKASHPGYRIVHISGDRLEVANPLTIIPAAIELFLGLLPKESLCQPTIERLNEGLRSMVTWLRATDSNPVLCHQCAYRALELMAVVDHQSFGPGQRSAFVNGRKCFGNLIS